MKKDGALRLIFATIVFACITKATIAQERDDSKSVHQGTVSIDAYYGVPNILLNIFMNSLPTSNQYHIQNIGPCGIRGEIFMVDHVAFGLDANYSLSTISWKVEETTGNYPYTITQITSYDVTINRLRVLAKCNFHFAANEHFDWYAGGGIGYNQTEYTQHKNGVASKYDRDDNFASLISAVPVSWRINFGGKYYFTPNIGAGMEVGICGGPLLSLALCSKF